MEKLTNQLSVVQQKAPSRAISWGIVVIAALLVLDLVRQLLSGTLTYALLTNYLWNGIIFGFIIGLGGIGLSLTYDLLNFANFAHGDYITASAFVGWGTTYLVAGLGQFDPGSLFFLGVGGTVYPGDLGISVTGTPFAILFGLIVAAVAGGLIALFFDRVVYQSMRKTGAITLLIASVGVAFIIRHLVVYVFTQQSFGLTVSAWSFPVQFPDGTLNVNAPAILLIGVTILVMMLVHLLLTRTMLGKAMRAMGDNRDLARITGIPSERIITFTWLIGGALAGIAGFLAVLLQGTITYTVGWSLLLLIFAGVIMGGIGSVYGAIVGGLLVGLITRISLVWVPSGFSEVIAFLVLVLVLLVKPSGLFGTGGSS